MKQSTVIIIGVVVLLLLMAVSGGVGYLIGEKYKKPTYVEVERIRIDTTLIDSLKATIKPDTIRTNFVRWKDRNIVIEDSASLAKYEQMKAAYIELVAANDILQNAIAEADTMIAECKYGMTYRYRDMTFRLQRICDDTTSTVVVTKEVPHEDTFWDQVLKWGERILIAGAAFFIGQSLHK